MYTAGRGKRRDCALEIRLTIVVCNDTLYARACGAHTQRTDGRTDTYDKIIITTAITIVFILSRVRAFFFFFVRLFVSISCRARPAKYVSRSMRVSPFALQSI